MHEMHREGMDLPQAWPSLGEEGLRREDEAGLFQKHEALCGDEFTRL